MRHFSNKLWQKRLGKLLLNFGLILLLRILFRNIILLFRFLFFVFVLCFCSLFLFFVFVLCFVCLFLKGLCFVFVYYSLFNKHFSFLSLSLFLSSRSQILPLISLIISTELWILLLNPLTLIFFIAEPELLESKVSSLSLLSLFSLSLFSPL